MQTILDLFELVEITQVNWDFRREVDFLSLEVEDVGRGWGLTGGEDRRQRVLKEVAINGSLC